jgi:hypothetical protein
METDITDLLRASYERETRFDGPAETRHRELLIVLDRIARALEAGNDLTVQTIQRTT